MHVCKAVCGICAGRVMCLARTAGVRKPLLPARALRAMLGRRGACADGAECGRRMANARVFEELKTALMSATPGQLNSHSTLKAAETLLQCLKRDGVATGTSGYNDGGAGRAHYGMNYVDG